MKNVFLNIGALFLLLLTLTGCGESGSYVYARISDDGRYVAVARHTENKANIWDYTENRRFTINVPGEIVDLNLSMNSDRLLVVVYSPCCEIESRYAFYSIKLKPPHEITQIHHSAYGIKHPHEVEPGRYLIVLNHKNNQNNRLLSQWHIIHPDKTITRLGTERDNKSRALSSITKDGFFIFVDDFSNPPGKMKPYIHYVSFGKTAMPNINNLITPDTTSIACSSDLSKCLREHVYLSKKTDPFKFWLELVSNGKTCRIEGLQDRIDRIQITPDGNYGIAVVASTLTAYSPRSVAVLDFSDGGCGHVSTIQLGK